MTRRCHSQTARSLRRWLALGFAAFSIVGCTALPEDSPTMERLDSETGITIARLGQPLELYRETFLQNAMGRFAFLAPFETNLMGSRELYLWVALPVDPAGSEPVIEVNGTALALGSPGRDAQFAGLSKSPYKIPTPWSAMYYYKVDAALIARLGEATDLSVYVVETVKDGTKKTLFAAPVVDGRLKEFATR